MSATPLLMKRVLIDLPPHARSNTQIGFKKDQYLLSVRGFVAVPAFPVKILIIFRDIQSEV
jgi:hypothetical protein